jgi:hypothetical protein
VRVLTLVPIVLAAALLFGQSVPQPDFNGRWKAIMEDGNLIPPYLAENIDIDHKGNRFLITSREEKPVTFRFAADGKEHLNTGRGLRIVTTAKWEGSALALTSRIIQSEGKEAKALERWTLSPNGGKLSMQGYFEGGSEKKNQLLQYERQ